MIAFPHFWRRTLYRLLRGARAKPVDGYCELCGGRTLVRRPRDGALICPQCDGPR